MVPLLLTNVSSARHAICPTNDPRYSTSFIIYSPNYCEQSEQPKGGVVAVFNAVML
jgi:hypothetical protein